MTDGPAFTNLVTESGEIQRLTDLGERGIALEIWSQLDDGTWTYVALLPQCLVDANRADLGLPPTNDAVGRPAEGRGTVSSADDEVAATANLIRYLYQDLGQAAGGPLHVELDDGNVADMWIAPDEKRYAYLFDGSFDRWADPGDDVSDDRKQEIHETCEAILAAFRRMPEAQRREAIAAAWRMLP